MDIIIIKNIIEDKIMKTVKRILKSIISNYNILSTPTGMIPRS